jgi:peptide/nickel transport system substrate-binding protein
MNASRNQDSASRTRRVVLSSAFALLAFAAPASAQKSKDTMRAALVENLGGVSRYFTFSPENSFLVGGVYDGLFYHDERRGAFQPLLAKSMKQPDPYTYDIELRDDVTWHDGEKFSADDVVYFFNWLIAPDNKLRNRASYTWMKTIEKTSSYSLRVVSHDVTAGAQISFAYLQQVEPKHIHEKLAPDSKADLGWNPVGTGPFKVTRLERSKGMTAVANDAYKHGGDWKPASKVKRWEFTSIPDRSTQIAQLLAGNLDFIRPDSQDMADQLMQTGRFETRLTQTLGITFLQFDAAGRKPNSPYRDVRVRRAIGAAIDRSQLVALSGTAGDIKQPEALCWRSMESCDYSKPFPKYDPEEAKRLLAEAGYGAANKLKIELLALEGRTRQQAEAISGMLSKVGVDAAIRPVLASVYVKMQGAGELGLYLGLWSGGGVPDVTRTMEQFFVASPRNYHNDPELDRLSKLVSTTQDPQRRRAFARQAFDIVNEQAYVLPLTGNDVPFIYSKDVRIEPDTFDTYGVIMSHVFWK